MNKINNIYGICLQYCFIINRNLNKREPLHQGDLIQIIESRNFIDTDDKILIILYNSDENIFKTDLFECAKKDVGYIEDALWEFMIGTRENYTRIRIYNERNLVLQLKCGTEITIQSFENDLNANIKGVVHLIDEVEEMGIGNFIGLKILNPPENRLTLLTLYKKYYNRTTSLFLFRIDQLLDAIKTSNIISDRQLLRTFTINGDRVEYPAVLQQTIINPTMNSDIMNVTNTGASPQPTYQIMPVQGDIKSNPDLFNATLTSGSNSYFSPALTSRQTSDNMQNNQIKTNYLSDLNQSNIDNLIQTPIYSAMKSSNVPTESTTSTQLVDVKSNEQRSMFNRHGPVDNKKKNYQFTHIKKKNNISKDIVSRNNPKYRKTKFNDRQKLPRCHLCRSQFDHNTLVLQCMHYICVECIVTKISSLIGISRVRCPFVSNSGFTCNYQLQNFELRKLRQKIDECVLMPTSENHGPNPKRNDFNDDEELFKCKTERCNGNWFISKSDSLNLFRCPVCKIINCVQCKAIHNNKSCTEFKNNRVKQPTLQDVVEKLNNLVLSYKQEGKITRPIRDGAESENNEILMNCKEINCVGQWLISKIDRNVFFKCPICKQYNCAECDAIHQSQTCDEYQEARQPEYSLQNQNIALPVIKNVAKRKWSCTLCTFINLSFSNTCQMCNFNKED